MHSIYKLMSCHCVAEKTAMITMNINTTTNQKNIADYKVTTNLTIGSVRMNNNDNDSNVDDVEESPTNIPREDS